VTSPIRITLVEDPAALWERRAEWNALAARGATNTVFQTCEWHCAWWKSLGGNARSLLLMAEREGRMVGIAPLMVSEQRILGRRRRVAEFIGTHAADYADFIVEAGRDDVTAALLAWLADGPRRFDLLHLINLAETSPLRALAPAAFRSRGFTADLERLYECPTRRLHDPAANQKLLRKKENRQHYDWLRKRGRLEFILRPDAAGIEPWLERFFEQHIARWAPTDTPSFFHDERQRAFYREKVRLMAPQGWIAFSVLTYDDTPISFHFGFHFGERLYVIKPTFNPDYHRHGPGMVHVRHLLELAIARGAAELDFTAGEEKYKYRFTNHARVNYALRVRRGEMFYGVDRVLRYAKAATAHAPGLRRLGRRVLEPWFGDTLRRLGL
jgi:CelD/BcsL family acetyltransferase involved in cellulose biosynthesis